MDIRLVCSDIDGTLLQYGKKELEGEIFDQIRALHQRGIWFCPASGRGVWFWYFARSGAAALSMM